MIKAFVCRPNKRAFIHDRLYRILNILSVFSTSPEDFKIRLKEHNEKKSTKKGGEERKFSSLSNPKEDIKNCPPPTFTKQKVRPHVSIK
jgi:predicted metal-binding transcription factor (methanogenesis marker protein 9)